VCFVCSGTREVEEEEGGEASKLISSIKLSPLATPISHSILTLTTTTRSLHNLYSFVVPLQGFA